MVWTDCILFVHASADRTFVVFYLLTAVTDAANICVHVFVWTHGLISLGHTCRVSLLDEIMTLFINTAVV